MQAHLARFRTPSFGEVRKSWGFLRLEKGRAPKPVTNVRDDQIRTNPSGGTVSRSDVA